MTAPVVAAVADVLADVLVDGTPVERERAAARALARALVGAHVGVAPDDIRITQVCAECGGPHGRPQVLGHDVHVAWSHSGGLVAVVVDERPCAVDVEAIASVRVPPVDVLTAAERRWLDGRNDPVRGFAELWVRKEVLVKLGLVSLDEAIATDVTPALDGERVLGVELLGLDTGGHDAVAAWATTAP